MLLNNIQVFIVLSFHFLIRHYTISRNTNYQVIQAGSEDTAVVMAVTGTADTIADGGKGACTYDTTVLDGWVATIVCGTVSCN